MPACVRNCSHGSSLAGGDGSVPSGVQRASEDCKMELTWVPVAAGCPQRTAGLSPGFCWPKAAQLGHQHMCGRSCLRVEACLVPAWSRAGSHPKRPPQGDLFQPCLEHCCFSQPRAQGNTEFGLIQHKSRSLLIFSFSLSRHQWGREKPTGSALSRGANHMQIAPLRWH